MTNESDSPATDFSERVFLVIGKQLFPIKKDVTDLGRHPSNDLIINEADISRKHAQIRYEKGVFVVYDLNAKYGTFVNNDKIDRCQLNSGDTVTLAGTPLLFIDRRSQQVSGIDDATARLEE